MPRCKYQTYYGDNCPFHTFGSADLCIFHLPVDQKDFEEFWKHTASYAGAILDHFWDDSDTNRPARSSKVQLFKLNDGGLYGSYRDVLKHAFGLQATWGFRGFVFPRMDYSNGFEGCEFIVADFSDAQFTGEVRFKNAMFLQRAVFYGARFLARTDFA